MKDLVLALDAGTTTIKAAVVDIHGKSLTVAEEDTGVQSPRNDERELDMDALAHKALRVLSSALTGVDRSRIAGIALAGQGDGAWFLDAALRPVAPAVLWNDGRAADTLGTMESSGELNQIRSTTRATVHPGSLPVLARHFAHHDPDRLSRTRYAINCKDWLRYHLTGVLETDQTDACRSYASPDTGATEQDLVQGFGDLSAGQLVPVSQSSEVRPLQRSAANSLGLAEGLPVSVGMMDVAAAGYAYGGSEPGGSWVIVGTTSFVGTVADHIVDRAGSWMPHPKEGLYLRSLAPMAGVPVLEWHRRILGLEHADWNEFESLALSARESDDPLTALPYLAPSGERAPFTNAQARGSLHGLTLNTTRAQIALAGYTGVALAIAECLDALDRPEEVSIAGGAGASNLLCQLIADYSGATLVKPATSAESGLVGASRLLFDSLGIPLQLDRTDAVHVRPTTTKETQESELQKFVRTRKAQSPLWTSRFAH